MLLSLNILKINTEECKYMKKRNIAMRVLAAILTSTVICTSVPVMGQEFFESGTQDTAEEFQEQQSQEDTFTSDNKSNAVVFSSEESQQDFQDGEISEEETDGIRYTKGRPLTAEEREEELEPFRNLTPLDPGPEVESDLTTVYAAYGSRATYKEKYEVKK